MLIAASGKMRYVYVCHPVKKKTPGLRQLATPATMASHPVCLLYICLSTVLKMIGTTQCEKQLQSGDAETKLPHQ